MVSIRWHLIITFMIIGILPAVIISTVSFKAGEVMFRDVTEGVMVLIVLFTLATLALALFTARLVSKPLRQLTESVDEISRGNLRAAFVKSSIDEVQSLTDSLARIIASLKLAVLRTGATTVELGLGEALEAKEKAEHEVKKEQEKAQRYLDLAGVIISAVDTSGKIVMVNRKACEILGYEEEEMVGKSFAAFVPERVRAETRAVMRKLAAGSSRPSESREEYHENPILTKSGEERLIAWRNVPMRNERGGVTGILSSGEDITERKRAEEALRKTREELEEAQRIAQLGRWHLDLAAKSLSWSSGIYALFGIEPEGFGASYDAFLKAVHPDDRRLVDSAFTASVKERRPYDITHRIVRPGGEVRWVREIGETAYDRKGKPLSSTGTVQDVTLLKKAEEAMRLEKEFSQKILDTIPFGADIIDQDCTILFMNRTFRDKFGKNAVGKKCYGIYRDDRTQCVDCPVRRPIAVGETASLIATGVDGGKTYRITHTGFELPDGRKAILEFFENITELDGVCRKAVAKLKAKAGDGR